MLTGSCLCGAIRYTIEAPITELRACHCLDCQKASGTGHAVNAVVPAAAFRLTQGTPKRYDARAASGRTLHRYFCGDCGSAIHSQRANNTDTVVVRAGSFDNPGDMKITGHIWTSRARPWSHIPAGVPQNPGQPDAPVGR